MTLIRSAIFFVWFALVSVVLNVGCLPLLALPRRITKWAPKAWCAGVLWGLKAFAGLDYEVRGTVPPDGVLIASKHMSMWDTVALYLVLNDGVAVIKKSLLYVPFYGWYSYKMRMIAIDRQGRASAMRKMIAAARDALTKGRAIIIFPEGHRMAPGAVPDYKPGVAGLYAQLGVACVPVALNSGLFWTGPGGFLKKPGKIVLEFLEPIPPGLTRQTFMTTLQDRIEGATTKLLIEGRAQLAG